MINHRINPCPTLCIDDLCHGNPDCTLCFGSYCEVCRRLTHDYGLCEQCRLARDGDYDDDVCPHGRGFEERCEMCDDAEDEVTA
jgi:hypothetical protein